MSLWVHLEVNKPCEVFSANITHNCAKMAKAANMYEAIWHPEEIGAKYAKDIIPTIEIGLKAMKAFPKQYKPLEASNGWGTYNQFISWVETYLIACIENPEAFVSANG